MLDDKRSVGFELVCTLKLLGLTLRGGRTRIGKTLVNVFEQLHLIIQGLEVHTAVGSPRSLVGYRVTELDTVDCGSAVPAVSGIVTYRARKIIKEGNLVEWRFILACERLIIAPGSTHRAERLPYSIFPVAVFVGEELAVYSTDSFLDACRGVGVERELQGLCKVP